MNPNDLLLFARVVDSGSFSGAAQRLGLPKSSVSRRVAALEAAVGERLLTRTTRRLTLTDFGQSLLEHARRVAEESDAATALAQHRQARPSGRLRVSMPADFAELLLPATLAGFAQANPAIVVDLDLSPRRVDLVAENFDLALRMGDLPDDATLVARRLADFEIGLFAAPTYLVRHGTPAVPDDLLRHTGLRLLSRTGDAVPWRLARRNEQWEQVAPGTVAANSPALLVRLALQGAGIVGAACHFVAPHLARGELVRLLPQWTLPPVTAWAVMPGRRLLPAKTRVFLDALLAALT
ncbi:MAG: LysR family transcriptional regulator [Betaproteobacteria bacterium]|nr:LysR family transcriptional regulator [Betaproteobacteria bacterium]